MDTNWFYNPDKVCELSRWLHDNGEWSGDNGVGNLIYFFEKPWKYTDEYKMMEEEKNARKVH